MSRLKGILQHQLVSKSFYNLVLRILGLGLSFILTKFIIMYYGMAGNGIWAIFHSLMLFILTFSRFGLHTSLIRLINKVKNENKQSLDELITKSLLIPIPLLLFFAMIFLLFREELNSYITSPNVGLLLLLTMVPYTYIFVASGILQGLHKVRSSILIVYVIVPFAMAACILIDQQMQMEWGALMCYSIGVWFTAVVAFFMIILYGYKPKWGKHITFKEIVIVSIPMMISGSMLQVIDWTDILVLRMYDIDKAVIGEYHLAVKVSNLTILGLFAVNSTVLPQIAKFWAEKDVTNYTNMVRQSTKMSFWLTAPIVVAISLLAMPILHIFDSSVGWSAVWVLLILMAGKFTRSLFGCVDTILNMSGQEKNFQKIILIVALVNLVLNIALIPVLDVYGAAISSAFSIVAWNIAAALLAKRKLNVLSVYLPFSKKSGK